MQNITFYFNHSDLDKVSYARELFENLLEKGHKSLLLSLFKPFTFEPQNSFDPNITFKEILSCPTYENTKVLKATAIYLIAADNLKELYYLLHQEASDPDKMVSETAKRSLHLL